MATPRPAFTSMDPTLFQRLAGKDGKLSAKEIGTSGVKPPPKGYSYTYDFKNTASPIALKKDGNAVLGKLGDVAKVAVPIILAATGVGAPAAAAIMAATYAADKKADGGSWGDAAKAGALGGAGGYLGAGGITSTGGKVAANAALGGAQGAMDGGGMKGAVVGAAGGAAGGGLGAKAGGGMATSGNGWGDVLKSLAKDPETYKAIAAVAGKAGEGQAAERAGANNYQQTQNSQANQQYGMQQSTLANLLGLQERATMDRAQMGVQAPNARMKQAILGSLLQNAKSRTTTAPAGIRMGKVSGGLNLDAISAATRAGGGELESQALAALKSKSDIPGATDYAKTGMMAAPEMGGYKDAGALESGLSGAGLLASLMAGIQKHSEGTGTGASARKLPPPPPEDEYGQFGG